MLSTGEEIRSPQRSSRSGPILAKMPCTISARFAAAILFNRNTFVQTSKIRLDSVILLGPIQNRVVVYSSIAG